MSWTNGDVVARHFFYTPTWENSWPISLRYRAEWVIVETRVRYAGDHLAASDPNTIPAPEPLIEFHHLVIEQPPSRQVL